MNFETIIANFNHPAVLFFFLGIFAILVKSDLEIPPQIGKFLSLYLLFDIGIKGGEELHHSGFSIDVLLVMLICVIGSFAVPFLVFFILRRKLNVYDAGAVAATYGSVSAVSFATATTFLESQQVQFHGHMVAGMAMMESPAIISGLIIIRLFAKKETAQLEIDELAAPKMGLGHVIHESLFNGSVLLLIGSLVIGYVTGAQGEAELKPFVSGIFFGMLSLYMLDMGLLAGRRLGDLRKAGVFVIAFALFFPMFSAALGIGASYVFNYTIGDALLQTVLFASASYIAVPAAMRIAVPQANMSILLPMSLVVTFTFNISIGIPTYFAIIQNLWAG